MIQQLLLFSSSGPMGWLTAEYLFSGGSSASPEPGKAAIGSAGGGGLPDDASHFSFVVRPSVCSSVWYRCSGVRGCGEICAMGLEFCVVGRWVVSQLLASESAVVLLISTRSSSALILMVAETRLLWAESPLAAAVSALTGLVESVLFGLCAVLALMRGACLAVVAVAMEEEDCRELLVCIIW